MDDWRTGCTVRIRGKAIFHQPPSLFMITPICKNIHIRHLTLHLIMRQESLELISETLVQNHRTSESTQIFLKFKKNTGKLWKKTYCLLRVNFFFLFEAYAKSKGPAYHLCRRFKKHNIFSSHSRHCEKWLLNLGADLIKNL